MAVSLVQTATPVSVNATSATITFAANVTAGNTICTAISFWDGSSSSVSAALTLGSSPDNWFLHRKATRFGTGSNSYSECWADSQCAGGTASVTVTLSGATGGLFTYISIAAWEVAGLSAAIEDNTGSGSGNSPSWSTGAFGANPTTTSANSFWWAVVTNASGGTITGPTSGWTNTATLSGGGGPFGGGGSSAMAGYEIPGAIGSPVYAGTFGSNAQWSAAGVTLKAGSVSGSAAGRGTGTVSAHGGIGGAATPSGTGTVTATALSGAPDTSSPAGVGTVAATGGVSIAGSADLSGDGIITGSANPPVVVHVVNQWAGTRAQGTTLGPAPPATSSVVVNLDFAASVGGGSGIPTAGNWLFVIAGWRQDPGVTGVTINVADDSRQWWRPTSPSNAAGVTRTAVWYQPNIGAITTTPETVYVAPSGYVAAMSVLVVEVTGLGPWDFSEGVSVAYSGSTTSITLTLTP